MSDYDPTTPMTQDGAEGAPAPSLPRRHRHGFTGPVRYSHYDSTQALTLAPELVHLETAAATPADPDLTWLAPAVRQEGFDLVTASVSGKLAGFAALVLGDHVHVERLVVATAALEAHRELPLVLVEAGLAHADRPWIDLTVPDGFSALPALLDAGWSVIEDDPENGEGGAIRLRAA